jgi:hypothetical protein
MPIPTAFDHQLADVEIAATGKPDPHHALLRGCASRVWYALAAAQ